MLRRVALWVGLFLVLPAASSQAQNAVLSRMYGSAAHAYFSQEYAQAHDLLTAVIQAGSQDPRVYYLRGLCYLKLAREEAAQADFEKGAALETADSTRVYNVPRALERIQGPERATLEQYRADARVAAMQRDETARKKRYEEGRIQQEAVLRKQVEEVPIAPGVPAAKSVENPAGDGFKPMEEKKTAEKPVEVPDVLPVEPKAGGDPFAAGGDKKAAPKGHKKVVEKPAATPAAVAPKAEDPFGAAAAEKPVVPPAAGADPFATPAEKPAAPAEKPAAQAGASPKPAAPAGGDALNDPFGAAPPAGAAPAAKPAASGPAGKPAASTPAAKPAAPAAKPAAGDDPFK